MALFGLVFDFLTLLVIQTIDTNMALYSFITKMILFNVLVVKSMPSRKIHSEHIEPLYGVSFRELVLVCTAVDFRSMAMLDLPWLLLRFHGWLPLDATGEIHAHSSWHTSCLLG